MNPDTGGVGRGQGQDQAPASPAATSLVEQMKAAAGRATGMLALATATANAKGETGKLVSEVQSLATFWQNVEDRAQDALDITPAQKWRTEVTRGERQLATLFEAARSGSTQAQAQLQAWADKHGEVGKGLEGLTARYRESMESIRIETENAANAIEINFGERLGASLSSWFNGVLEGTRSWKSALTAWKDFTVGLVGDLFAQIIEKKLNWEANWEKNWFEDIPGMVQKGVAKMGDILSDLFEWMQSALNTAAQFFSLGGSAAPLGPTPPGPQFSGVLMSSQGPAGVPWQPSLSLAAGGITTGSTVARIGEAGPEAVLPLTKMRDIMGEIGGGNGPVSISIHAPTQLASQKRKQDSAGREMIELIFSGAVNAAAQDVTSGGVLGQAIESSFGSARSGGR